jgi:hypothetical protein
LELQALEAKISATDVSKRVSQLGKAFQATSGNIQSVFAGLESRLGALEMSADPFAGPNLGPVPRASQSELDELKAVVDSVLQNPRHTTPTVPQDVLDRITELEVAALDQEPVDVASAPYSFEDYTFTSAEDLCSQLGKSLDGVTVGQFIDTFGLTCRLEDDFSSGKDYADKRRATTTTGITGLEADNMSTMTHTSIPFFFAKAPGKPLPVAENAGFGHRLETFARFSAGQGTSTKLELSQRVLLAITRIKGTISGNDVAKRLARHLLTEVMVQVGLISAFFSDYYSVLIDDCHYTPKAAWHFIGVSFRAICNHLIPPRIGISALDDLAQRPVKAQIIWGILQVHSRLNSIINAGFKSHSVLTTAMSDFIMRNRIDGAQLEAAEKRIGHLEAAAKAAAADLKVIKGKGK